MEAAAGERRENVVALIAGDLLLESPHTGLGSGLHIK